MKKITKETLQDVNEKLAEWEKEYLRQIDQLLEQLRNNS